jgi:CBS-domain-containing membrane protein
MTMEKSKMQTLTVTDGKVSIPGVVDGFDLSPYQDHQATKIRLVVEKDGTLSVDPLSGDWLAVEIDIPAKQTVTMPVLDAKTAKPILDEDGQEKTKLKIVPIESVAVKTWAR